LLVVLVVVCELVDPEDVEVDPPDAALAMAAPPPTRPAVTASVVMMDLSRICDSPPLLVRARGCGPSVLTM
jgi:hypothetical protein